MFRIQRQQLLVLQRHFLACRQCSNTKNSEVFKQQRISKLKNIEMYPYRFDYNSDISTFRDSYKHLKHLETTEEESKLVGMITNIRDYGNKLKFLDIERNGESLQLKISKEHFRDEIDFMRLSDIFSKGDKVGEVTFCYTQYLHLILYLQGLLEFQPEQNPENYRCWSHGFSF